mmetsp:Transcript_23108/g.21002  ORF Transcript_23108/g.21002 Transcript_23108/m.21002 type:complete len:149 (-) Transcript_23108:846-1292(-)
MSFSFDNVSVKNHCNLRPRLQCMSCDKVFKSKEVSSSLFTLNEGINICIYCKKAMESISNNCDNEILVKDIDETDLVVNNIESTLSIENNRNFYQFSGQLLSQTPNFSVDHCFQSNEISRFVNHGNYDGNCKRKKRRVIKCPIKITSL